MQTQRKNVVQIRKYTDYYKITVCKSIISGKKENQKEVEKQKHEKKLENNISRAKRNVLEKAICNQWDFFVTLTLDPEKYNRDDLKGFIKDLSQFIRNYRRDHKTDVKYLLIPELHKDGKNWHMHGLISGLDVNTDIEPHPVKRLRGKGYVNWVSYAKRFGFCSLGRIQDDIKVSMYITKYITKDLDHSVSERNAKLYYCSRGLKTSELVSEGCLYDSINFEMAFEGRFSKSQFVDNYEFFKEYYKEYNDVT